MTLRTSHVVRRLAVPAVIGLVLVSAPPASANYISGPGRTCSSGEQVRISATTNGGSSYVSWISSQGQLKQTWKSGMNFYVNTGDRSITNWQVVNNDTRVNVAYTSCV